MRIIRAQFSNKIFLTSFTQTSTDPFIRSAHIQLIQTFEFFNFLKNHFLSAKLSNFFTNTRFSSFCENTSFLAKLQGPPLLFYYSALKFFSLFFVDVCMLLIFFSKNLFCCSYWCLSVFSFATLLLQLMIWCMG